MDEYLQWLLAGLSFLVLLAWLGCRVSRRAAAKRKAAVQEAARVEAARLAQAEKTRAKAADEAARAAAANVAAEQAARAKAARLAAEEAARTEDARAAAREALRAEAARVASAQGARAQAARAAAEKPARAEAARLAAEELAHARASRVRVHEAVPLEAKRRPNVLSAKPAAKTPDQTLIMIADDSKLVRIKTGRLLAQHQYRVSYAIDGLDAAQQMQTSIPDVVITDVEMPGMDGFELVRHVRQNPLTAHVPIIMISAADDRHREHANRAGVNVLLGKPYAEEELIAQIRQATNREVPQARAFAESSYQHTC